MAWVFPHQLMFSPCAIGTGRHLKISVGIVLGSLDVYKLFCQDTIRNANADSLFSVFNLLLALSTIVRVFFLILFFIFLSKFHHKLRMNLQKRKKKPYKSNQGNCSAFSCALASCSGLCIFFTLRAFENV